MTLPRLLLVLLMGLLPPASGAGGAYKWVDKDGNVHFSDRPPEEAEESVEELELEADIDPARAAEGQARLDDSINSLEQRRSAQDAAAEQRQRQQTEAEREAARRQARCHLARSNLQVLREQRPVYSFDEKGERVFVEDQDRQARIERHEQEVREFCR